MSTQPPDQLCPCLSGKPYKDCHGLLERAGIEMHSPITPQTPPPEVILKMGNTVREGRAKTAERRMRLGETQLPNAVLFGGSRKVAVGGTFYDVDPRYAPLNFMSALAIETLGRSWFGEQLKLAEDSSGPLHPIISWYRDAMEWQQRNADENNQVSARLSGPAKAWFLLAYDVWVLEHHFLLKPLLDRVRDLKQFQGARYELTTYALFVRGEFTPERDEETDTHGKHVEFFARHRTTGEQVAVEAKCRHRPGVLGYPRAGYKADSDPEPQITGLLRTAFAQRRPMPYVICIELNLPPAADEQEARKKLDAAHNEVELVSREYTQNGEGFPATLVVVTNYAHHYGEPDKPDQGGYQTVMEVRDPAHPFNHPETTRQIIDALSAYGNLPRSWEDFDR